MTRSRLSALLALLLVSSLLLGLPASPATSSSSEQSPVTQRESTRGTGALRHLMVQGPNLIRLLAGAFDPLAQAAPQPAGIPHVAESALPAGVAQYWLVQVRDTQFARAIAAVESSGGHISGYLPDATYIVRATPQQRARFAADPSVRWSGYYQPAWRVPIAAGERKGLLDLEGSNVYRVHVFADDPAPEAVAQALARIEGVRIIEDAGTVFDVEATAAQVPQIAALPAVEWIGVPPKAVPLNANARWVNDTGIRDLYAATKPGRLTGAGQTAAVADTGINYRYDLNGRAHIAFRDCDATGFCKEAIYTQVQPGDSQANMNNVVDNNTNHRKMVAYFDLGSTGPNMFDTSSHGTHTAGSVDGDKPPYNTWTGDDGLAPAANHVHQNIGDSGGGLGGLPADDYDLWRQAYRPRNPASVPETSPVTGNPIDHSPECVDPPDDPEEEGITPSYCYRAMEDARTHNNSYGLIVNLVDDGTALTLDRFVWDHEDMSIIVSAGNEGPGAATIGSPSVAKNEFSSGASANGRQPMVSIDSMAIFSSHGPTADGRFGVDVATPGQVVVSSKGGSTDGYHVAQGTSMSAPVLTGLTTLVRQYFFDGYGPAGGKGFAGGARNVAARRHNPSAALVKATLVNGAVRMRGWYTGDEGADRALDGQWPSGGQGFGRVNLNNSLYFNNDPTNNWYHDVYRADPEAFPAGGAASRSYDIQVAEGQPFDVTLAWTDAPINLAAGSPTLTNNLNLTVTGPSGTFVGNNMNTRVMPQADQEETLPGAAAADSRNPVERVRIAAPAAGVYTVTVSTPAIAFGNQGFALAASGLISPVDGSFKPGPPLQVDAPGTPLLSPVEVEPVSSDVAKLKFTTDEPTKATAAVDLDQDPNTPPFTFVDSYNIGNDDAEVVGDGPGWPGLDEGPVETSDEYSNKPVIGKNHEILLTGLKPGQSYSIVVTVTDLAESERTRTVSYTSLTNVYQPLAQDMAQLAQTVGGVEPGPLPIPDSSTWRTATQMYAGVSGTGAPGLLGAFAFRIPEGAIDPSKITGAVVEMRSSHNWVVPYTQDPIFYTDLLDDAVEPNWGTQNYDQIHNAPLDARVYPETTHKRGDYFRYPFTFRCADLEQLKSNLSTVTQGERMAAFRWDTTPPGGDGLFSMEFGYNRRSKGAEMRPRLILFTSDNPNPTGQVCDPATPAPKITDVGIHAGIEDTGNVDPQDPPESPGDEVTVSWETDVPANSMVIFREKGTTGWIQVGSPALTRIHHVEVFGLDHEKEYIFMVRSSACNGATTTDRNKKRGYDFFRDPPPVVPTDTYFFHGNPTDEAVKQTMDPPYPPDTLTFSLDPPDDTPADQSTTPFANEDAVGNSLTAFWTGPFTGDIDNEVEFQWYWSTSNPEAVALGANLVVSFFADPDYAAANRIQPERLIGRAPVEIGFTAPGVPTLNVSRVPVSGTVENELLIQVESIFTDTGSGLTVQYDSETTPSKFLVPLEPAEDGAGQSLPLTGPVPPPGAGLTNLGSPPTRTGEPTAADLAAGTGMCFIPEPIVVVGHAHTDYSEDGTPQGRDVHVRPEVHGDVNDPSQTQGVVEYRDLRSDPPGAADRGFGCTATVESITVVSDTTVLLEGSIDECRRSLENASRFTLRVQDNGPNPPKRDSYRMIIRDANGAILYNFSALTTIGLGDLDVQIG